MKNTFVALLLLCGSLLMSSVSAAAAASPPPCENVAVELASNRSNLEMKLSSIDSLIGHGTHYETPLAVLFQVDFGNSVKVMQRKTELEGLLDKATLLDSPEFKRLMICATTTSLASQVDELARMQSDLNAKKFAFFEMADELRTQLIAAYQAGKTRQGANSILETQLADSQNALGTAQAELQRAESESAVTTDKDKERILTRRAEVEKYNFDVAVEQVQFVDTIRNKTEVLVKLQADLGAVAKIEGSQLSTRIAAQYLKASQIWEAAVDNILELFTDFTIQSKYELPALATEVTFSSDEVKALYQAYVEAHQKADQRRLSLSNEKIKLLHDLKAVNFNLLNSAGTLRATLIQECDRIWCDRPRGFNEKNLMDTLRELKAVPLRAASGVLSKWLEIRGKAASGLDGWMDLLSQAFVLGVILVIPFMLRKLLNWLTRRLDAFRGKLLSRSMLDPKRRTQVAILISRMNPFIPSIGMIFSVYVAQMLIETTDFKVLSGLLTYLLLYFYYQFARLLLGVSLEVLFSTSSVNRLNQQKAEIGRSAARISRLIFIEYALLLIIEGTVRTGLIHNIVSDAIFWINIAFVIIESKRWKDVICEAFEYRFPETWKRIVPYYAMKLSVMLTPLLFFAVVANDLLRLGSSRLLRLDFMKQILSELFKRRLNQAVKEAPPRIDPPQEYLDAFQYYLTAKEEFFIRRESSALIETKLILDGWAANSSADDLVIIVGDRGMGKTTTLDKVYEEIGDDALAKIYRKVPARTLGNTELFSWLSEATGTSINCLEDFSKFDGTLERKIVFFVDEIHNFFVSTIGGFDAYRTFMEIISLQTHNVFWCLTINARSWAYLKGVFGDEHFYGKVVTIKPWQDHEIQKLILARHETTNYRRTFDKSISAYAGGDSLGQQAETQFFRLLWGQSRGNPRSALMYWISAISAPDPEHIHVGVPAFVSSSLVSTMSDDTLFLLASIARHESLSLEEMRATTQIDGTIIRRNLKEARDKDLVWWDDSQRIRISSRAQYVIDYFLIGKNFLHE